MTIIPATILIIDDNISDLESLSAWLNSLGHETIQARSAKEAFGLLNTLEVDLILLDIMMPDPDGYQILLQLKAADQYNEISVIVISALEDFDSVVRCIKAGATDYLFKPLNEVLLKARIDATLIALLERKKAESFLLDSEERYRVISELTSDIPFSLSVTKEGEVKVEWVGDAYTRVTGYSMTEEPSNIGNHLDLPNPGIINFTSIYPDDLDIVRQQYKNLLSGKPGICEYKFFTREGKVRWLRDYARPIWDMKEGRVVRIIGAAQDITIRKQAEESLKASEEHLNLIFDLAPIGMAITGLDGHYLRVNQALCNTFGFSSEEMIGMNFADISSSDDNTVNLENREKLLNGDVPGFKMEKRFYSKEGQIVYTLLQVTLIRNALGEPQHYIGQVVNITDQKKIEEALQRANNEQNQRVNELQARNREVNLLNEMGDLLQSCQTKNDAYSVVAQFMETLFDQCPGGLYALSDSHRILELVAAWGENQTQDAVYDARKCWALRRGQLHIVTEHQSKLCCHPEVTSKVDQSFRPYICIPLVAQGDTFGVLHIIPPKDDPKNYFLSLDHWEQLVRSVAERAALALANLKLREILHIQSIRDGLTNLFNRRYMEETLERELHRAQRRGTNLGVMMMDLDLFKSFNDTYGHDAGDALLRELGNYLQISIRMEDIACRYGGEEFVIILPEINQDDVVNRAENLRQGIKDIRLQYRGQFLRQVTMSFGIAMYPQHGPTAIDLIRSADTALYQAKNSGRDRVELA